VGTAETLRDLLSGSRPPASLAATIDDALTGRIATPEELRGRLLAEVTQEAPTVVAPPPPQPRRRPWWPWALAALLVVAAAVVIGILLAQGDDDGTRVPDVAGFTAEDAVQTLRDAGFVPRTVGRPSEEVAEGIVIATEPAGGEEADEGAAVTVAVSQGRGDVPVPTLVGLDRDDAVAAVQDAGLESRVVEQPSATAPDDTVTAQDPAAGLRVPAGSTVALTVAVAAATTVVTTPTAPTPPPATVAVPDVVGLTADDASTRLLAAGLQPGQVTEAPASGVPEGRITAQDPAAGTQVAPRTAVDVTVAAGAGG
jgi:serine/threonine-protein kinase